ncbi:hypothetical protein AVEN_4008-1 [Araneus ventricosus]|uniref:Uncharacterized protein n=1 Tax=Araneus ventricosus TaxID=182803 RepID=A0A4Y2H4A1_ARAVE|nr:hypothetical protein AVEN_4008-1 [Araneus ventricosus]
MTRTTLELAPPLQTSAPYQREDIWRPTYDLTCSSPNTRRIFNGIEIRAWSPPAPEVKTLPLGHRGSRSTYGKEAWFFMTKAKTNA